MFFSIYILTLELTNLNMIETIVEDYAAYFKLDVVDGFRTVQDVVDNMLTRLEELTTVLQMIKLKNSDCGVAINEDISKYRSEVTTLSKKITTVSNVIIKLQSNVDLLEKQVEKAEIDFGVNNENKIISLLKPFLKKRESTSVENLKFEKLQFESVMNNFYKDNNE